jgi:TolB-like protein
VVLGVGWLGVRSLRGRTAATAGTAGALGTPEARLAVLPFDAMSGGDTTLSRAAAQLLAEAVGSRFQMPAVDPRDLFGQWAAEKRSVQSSLADLAEFAGRLGATQMAVGNAVEAGRQLRLSVNVYDTQAQTRLAGGDVTGDKDSLFVLVDRLAAYVASTRCNQPDFNPQHLCFDAPPRLLHPVVATVPAALAKGASAPSYWVRVSKAGGVSDTQVRRASSNDSVTTAGLLGIQSASYEPATKGGKPVEAWLPVSVTVRKGQ